MKATTKSIQKQLPLPVPYKEADHAAYPTSPECASLRENCTRCHSCAFRTSPGRAYLLSASHRRMAAFPRAADLLCETGTRHPVPLCQQSPGVKLHREAVGNPSHRSARVLCPVRLIQRRQIHQHEMRIFLSRDHDAGEISDTSRISRFQRMFPVQFYAAFNQKQIHQASVFLFMRQ